MARYLLILGLLLSSTAGFTCAADTPAREALKELNDFIGEWKGSGGPVPFKPISKDNWSESISWSWKFKGNDAWLTMTIKDGKYFKSGELRYLPDKKLYQFTALTTGDKKQVYEGKYQDDYLRLERVDPETKETQRLTMNLAAEGVRFIYQYERKPADRTLFVKDYQVACTREGEGLAARDQKKECIVTGGLGTMTVTYKGQTYYVCCTGCRDAFNEEPEKYIAELKAKKGGK